MLIKLSFDAEFKKKAKLSKDINTFNMIKNIGKKMQKAICFILKIKI